MITPRGDVFLAAAGQGYTRQGRVGAQRPRQDCKETITEQQTEAEPERPADEKACWSGSHTACQGTHTALHADCICSFVF